jgi:hypothetical protein
MDSKVLIGIHGKPRAGKDTLANFLVDKYNLLRYGPSMPVKAATAAMFNVPLEYLSDDNMKEQIDSFWKMSYREMMQKIGKECSRDIFGEDFWLRHVDKVWARVKDDLLTDVHRRQISYNGMILADVRYANEITWVKQRGGLVIFVTREDRKYVANAQHVAEQGLPLDLADVVIPNNDTIVELHERASLVIEPLIGD